MNDHIRQLYTRFLQGTITPEEFECLKNSIEKISDETLSSEMEQIWETSGPLPRMQGNRKKRLHTQIRNNMRQEKRFRLRGWTRVAASVLVLCTLSLSVWKITRSQYEQATDAFIVEVPAGNRINLNLPDRTSVKVNAETFLSYNHMQQQKRTVELTGEAYFDVAPDKRHPFIVKTSDLIVEVTGTQFNVSSYPESDLIEVALQEGSVSLYGLAYEKLTDLHPSQKAIYSKSRKTLTVVQGKNQKDIGWTNETLIFESETLESALAKIQRWYGVSIELEPGRIAEDPMSGSFKNEPLDAVLTALSIQWKLNYTIAGKQVVIRPLK